MKENYWRQNELENEEFRRQKEESEHDLRAKQEREQLHEEDRQQRRKLWQRLARRKAHQVKLENKKENVNNNNNNIRATKEATTTTPIDDQHVNYNNNIDVNVTDFDGDDFDFDAHHQQNNNNNSNSGGDKQQRSEEEILQILSEQQKRLFEATAEAAAAKAARTAATTAPAAAANNPRASVEERQQVKSRLQQQQPVTRDEKEFNLSFCGCGFLGIYHVGVASCFHEYAPQLSMHKISGSSAGALVAVAHICGNLQLAYATTDILRVAIDARARALGPFHPSFDINALVREALEKGLPEDVHEKANGKLHVSLTRVYDGENVIISEFGSKEDVIQVLLCSCFIPFWSGLVAPKYKGVTYIDGGFSNNLLTLDDMTITVSPFAGEADICPQDDTFNLLQISLSNTSFSLSPNNLYRLSHALLPPPPEILSDLCEQGFADGIRFLQRMKLISCTKCLEIRSSLLVTTNGEDMEEAFTSELEDAVGGGGGGGAVSSSAATTSVAGCGVGLSDDVAAGWKRFSSNCSGVGATSSTASTTGPVAAMQEDYLSQQQQQQHYPHIILEQQEQKTIEINSTTGQRRDSIRSTTSQVFIQQQQHQQNSSKQNHLDSSTSSSASPKTTTACAPTTSSSSELESQLESQRFPSSSSSWQLNVNNKRRGDDATPIRLDHHADNASLASCNECVQMRKRALNQPMPKQFSDRIRDACDTVNKSLSNWIYSHRPIKYLSYLAAPYFLPLDISLALVYKCWRRLPFIRSEVISCIQELVGFLVGIMKRMLLRTTSTLLVESSSNWEYRAIEYEKELINRASHVSSPVLAANGVAPAAVVESNDYPAAVATTNRNSTCSSTASASTTTSESHYSLRITSDGVCLSKQSRHSTSSCQLHSLEDTFDSIVDVTSNQEARIFAYYFRDAKNRLQVTEIFDYQRAASSCNLAPADNHSSSASGTNTTTTTEQPANKQPALRQPQQPLMISAPEQQQHQQQ